MLTIFSSDETLAERAALAAGESRDTETVRAWTRLRKIFPRAEQVVVVAPRPSADLFARIRALSRRDPDVPFVIVTRPDPEALRWLKGVDVAEVVWIDELDAGLPLALQRIVAEPYFRELGVDFSESPRLSPVLGRALARAVRRRPPFPSVRALAAAVDRDRRTIWHHWRDAVGQRRDLTPKGFLDWILLLRAAVGGAVTTPWRLIARDLGIHARTLRRTAGRRLDVSLRGLRALGLDGVRGQFRRKVREPLLRGQPAGAGSRTG